MPSVSREFAEIKVCWAKMMLDCGCGYAFSFDLTRRDLQGEMKNAVARGKSTRFKRVMSCIVMLPVSVIFG